MPKKTKETKELTIEEAMARIRKKYGTGAIRRLDSTEVVKIDAISTGVKDIDDAIGIGGIPKGRITELFGLESSGKSTLSLMMIHECQKTGGTAALIDVEHAYDPGYSKRFGVHNDKLLISQPDSGEEALQIVEELIKSKVELIVIDTVAALTPMKEIEKEIGYIQIAPLARLMSQSLRKLNTLAHNSNAAILFLNQVRINPMIRYGSKETSPGGKALKFYASVRIHIKRIKKLVKGADRIPIGFKIQATIVKNKVGPPFNKAEFDLFFVEPKEIKE